MKTKRNEDYHEQKKNRQIAYLIIIVLTILVAAYVALPFFSNAFNYGTRIDGIPVGGYSVEKGEKLIGQEIKKLFSAAGGTRGCHRRLPEAAWS